MKFCIQDPSYKDSMYLQESLLTACEVGISGGGAYAFASKDGIELFLEDESFKKFMDSGTFFLIVGMDDITNIRSLQELKNVRDKYKGHLTVKAYIHNSKGSIFHPKFSWFETASGGILIVGSGNLTQQGLRHNREAYSVIDCDKKTFNDVISEWNQWLSHSNPFLFDIDDLIVQRVAEQNTMKTIAVRRVRKDISKAHGKMDDNTFADLFKTQPKDNLNKKKKQNDKCNPNNLTSDNYGKMPLSELDDEIDSNTLYWKISLKSEVLVAEIPRSGNRWKQANFDKNTFENYFGATCGENGAYRILLKNVDKSGTLGKTEVRPSVSVSSQNYRFELDAAAGIDYPKDGKRPLGVFVKVSQRDFLYELVMPGDEGYDSLIVAMDEKEAASAKMRRLQFYCKEISKKTPDLAIWRRIGDQEDDE